MALLRRGSQGPLVEQLQRALSILTDGTFGPATEAAVKQFQANNSLTVDGIAGPLTLATMGIRMPMWNPIPYETAQKQSFGTCRIACDMGHFIPSTAWSTNSTNMWLPYDPVAHTLLVEMQGTANGKFSLTVEIIGWQ
ncbi:hypothetical protein Pelo_3246 [Pelomyxa schiedti]|nr:hypothetical protein Pelo_3246 [Pelomyxa schiedti]